MRRGVRREAWDACMPLCIKCGSYQFRCPALLAFGRTLYARNAARAPQQARVDRGQPFDPCAPLSQACLLGGGFPPGCSARHTSRKGSASSQKGETRDVDDAVELPDEHLWLPDERWASRELLSTHHHGARRRRRTTTTVRCRRCFTITYPRDSLTHDNTKKEGPRNYWRRVARLRINRLREHHTTK